MSTFRTRLARPGTRPLGRVDAAQPRTKTMKKAFKQALRQIVQGTVKIVAVIVLIMVGAALLHDFAPRKVVAMDALERAYQQMAKEPDALPALTTLRVAER